MLKEKKDIDNLIKLMLQLDELKRDFNEFTKKKPTDAVNLFKLSFINFLLDNANKFLDNKFKPFPNFELFDEDKLPVNSDVLIILNQYVICLKNYASEQIIYTEYLGHFWKLDGKRSEYAVDLDQRTLIEGDF